ncbi:NAD-dependent succinate-semialdehyde dehydrogenase [Francisella frigiditurris]|uniref:Aldehyde dehydrogenase family protein n=1 Tax=Francisella frigiditurris TaxID=1542390 RepID=A0A1J0KRH6_9GAMM|nr:NAD-dependent succinate-semialdehyde dehydrogenase [Francisella frigiditurris]APC96311.1 aldehyde dehydrogenase family protein [Francisella frigiditurris]
MNILLTKVVKKFNVKEGFEVINPVNKDKLATIANNTNIEIKESIRKAKNTQKEWNRFLQKEKSKILRKWYELLIQNIDDLAQIITLESGKPLLEARAEVNYSAGFIEWYAEKAKRIDGKLISSPFPNTEIKVTYEPVGVVAAIAPWNFPLAMITRKIAPAFAAGCAVVVKPSELTPLSALAAKILAEEAGIPKNLFQVVCGDSKEIGKEMTSNIDVRKITFTGSTRIGKLLMSQSSQNVKKISLELGGNAPFIVFDTADIDVAVKALLVSKFRNAGQVCIAPNRIFVQENIKPKFIKILISEVSKLKVGNGLEEGVIVGPLISDQAITKVKTHIKNAVDNGAKVILGGKSHELGGTFFEPTVIDGMTDNMQTSCEEVFGPVVNIYTFKTEEEAITRANNTPYGLASYFFSNDVKQIERVRNAIEAGMIGINFGVLSTESAPFGGVKESGLGREGSDDGIYEFLEPKYSMQSFN